MKARANPAQCDSGAVAGRWASRLGLPGVFHMEEDDGGVVDLLVTHWDSSGVSAEHRALS